MAKYILHLAVNFKGPVGGPPGLVAPDRSEIEALLDKASDWLRYAPNCWLIYTAKNAKTWYERLVALPGMKQHSFFICEVNLSNRAGWMGKTAWEWIRKYQTQGLESLRQKLLDQAESDQG